MLQNYNNAKNRLRYSWNSLTSLFRRISQNRHYLIVQTNFSSLLKPLRNHDNVSRHSTETNRQAKIKENKYEVITNIQDHGSSIQITINEVEGLPGAGTGRKGQEETHRAFCERRRGGLAAKGATSRRYTHPTSLNWTLEEYAWVAPWHSGLWELVGQRVVWVLSDSGQRKLTRVHYPTYFQIGIDLWKLYSILTPSPN